MPNISALIYLGMILLLLLFYCTKKTTCFYLPSSQLLFYNIYFFFPVKKIVHVHCRKFDLKKEGLGIPLVVQWLGLCTFTAGGVGSIPGRGTKILHAVWHSKKKKKERRV